VRWPASTEVPKSPGPPGLLSPSAAHLFGRRRTTSPLNLVEPRSSQGGGGRWIPATTLDPRNASHLGAWHRLHAQAPNTAFAPGVRVDLHSRAAAAALPRDVPGDGAALTMLLHCRRLQANPPACSAGSAFRVEEVRHTLRMTSHADCRRLSSSSSARAAVRERALRCAAFSLSWSPGNRNPLTGLWRKMASAASACAAIAGSPCARVAAASQNSKPRRAPVEGISN